MAAPALGAAIGTGAGLSGAAATSHGLAILGGMGGATASGTLTTGGMWFVGQSAAVAGGLSASMGSVLYDMGAANAQREIIKLQVTYKLILLDLQRNSAAALEVTTSLNERLQELESRLEEERGLNDPESDRITDLEATAEALEHAQSWMAGNIAGASRNQLFLNRGWDRFIEP